MRKQRYLVVVGLLVAGAVIIGVLASPGPAEPVYKGKKLSEWVVTYGNYDPIRRTRLTAEAIDALGEIGTNAIPYLLKWIGYDTPSWKAKLCDVFNARVAKMNPRWRITDDRDQRAEDAAAAFQFAGPEVIRALPDLIKVMNNAKATRSSARAAEVLGCLGTAGRQPLLAAMNTAPAWVANYIIGFLGTNASPGIPPVLRALEDPDPTVRARASNVLRWTSWDPAQQR